MQTNVHNILLSKLDNNNSRNNFLQFVDMDLSICYLSILDALKGFVNIGTMLITLVILWVWVK